MNLNPTHRQTQDRAADAYMRARDGQLLTFTQLREIRRAFLAGWDAAKRDSHQARQAKRDDIAAELGELMADTKQEEDDNDLIGKEDER